MSLGWRAVGRKAVSRFGYAPESRHHSAVSALYDLILARRPEPGLASQTYAGLGPRDIAKAILASDEAWMLLGALAVDPSAIDIRLRMPVDQETQVWLCQAILTVMPAATHAPASRAGAIAALIKALRDAGARAQPRWASDLVLSALEDVAEAQRRKPYDGPLTPAEASVIQAALLGADGEPSADLTQAGMQGAPALALSLVVSQTFLNGTLKRLASGERSLNATLRRRLNREQSRLIAARLASLLPEAGSEWRPRHPGDLLRAVFESPTVRAHMLAAGVDGRIIDAAAGACVEMLDDKLNTALVGASKIFDGDWYRREYQAELSDQDDPLQHFVTHGMWASYRPNAYFDPDWYASRTPGEMTPNPFIHYLTVGIPSFRSPSRDFDPVLYARAHPAISSYYPSLLAHYMAMRTSDDCGERLVYPDYWRIVMDEEQAESCLNPEYKSHMEAMTRRVMFAVFIDGEDDSLINETVCSLNSQIYVHFTIVERAEVANPAPRETYFIWLKAGDVLSPTALYHLAGAVEQDPDRDIIYTDDDVTRWGIKDDPFFKPDYSPDYVEGVDYIGRSVCYRARLVSRFLALANCPYDLLLRSLEVTDRVHHVPRVSLTVKDRSCSQSSDAAIKALTGRLNRSGRTGTVSPVRGSAGAYQVRVDSTGSDLISLIIPTAGRTMQIAGTSVPMLENCIDKILSTSTYRNIEIIVVHNGDLGVKRSRALEELGCKLIYYDKPVFNVSMKLNLGASIASGSYLVLLNDDTEPLNPDWIERLLEHAQKPHVGVVGGKLLYPNKTVQHAGVVFQFGWPDHVSRGDLESASGYFHSLQAPRNYLAVTGACMMARRDVFLSVGGYTECLPISYNDVDFCLKVREQGLSCVFTPFSRLIHYESQSRETALDPDAAQYLPRVWAKSVIRDPFYNDQHLATSPPTFQLRRNVRCI